MVVGHDMPFLVQDKPGAQAIAVLLLGTLRERRPKEREVRRLRVVDFFLLHNVNVDH
jgi:hypothetical protein